jgi:hypothetical protein
LRQPIALPITLLPAIGRVPVTDTAFTAGHWMHGERSRF